jgi:hypothetical protein
MTPEEAAEVILAGERWEYCPEGCDYGRIAVTAFPPGLSSGEAIFTIGTNAPLKHWVKCKRCNGTGLVTPQPYIEASAQLGLLVPQSPLELSYTLSAWVFPPGKVKVD